MRKLLYYSIMGIQILSCFVLINKSPIDEGIKSLLCAILGAEAVWAFLIGRNIL